MALDLSRKLARPKQGQPSSLYNLRNNDQLRFALWIIVLQKFINNLENS
jgi:hypothetical protein